MGDAKVGDTDLDNRELDNVELENGDNVELEIGELTNIEPPLTSVPEDSPVENTPKIRSPTTPLYVNALDTITGYVLPFKHNRGKPPNRYSPNEEERISKYPITNYVSTQDLSKPIKTFT